MGNALYVQKKLDEAITAYRQAITLNPKDDLIYLNLAYTLFEQGGKLFKAKQFRQAFEAFDQLTRLDPTFVNAWYGRGVALGQLKRYSEAISSFDQAIRLKPGFREAIDARRQAQMCLRSNSC